MTKPIGVNWSHGRPRSELRRRSDGGVPALPPKPPVVWDPESRKFAKGNQGWKIREAKRLELVRRKKGLSTLNPLTCEPWLQPFAAEAMTYALELQARFDDPALARLIGDTADSHAVYKGLVALGAKGDVKALAASLAWLREHRACLRELASLAAMNAGTPSGDAAPWDVEAIETK